MGARGISDKSGKSDTELSRGLGSELAEKSDENEVERSRENNLISD